MWWVFFFKCHVGFLQLRNTAMNTELMPLIYQFKTILLFSLFNLEKMSILSCVSSLYWSWHWCNMELGRESQLSCFLVRWEWEREQPTEQAQASSVVVAEFRDGWSGVNEICGSS